jgi:hypothetical protein
MKTEDADFEFFSPLMSLVSLPSLTNLSFEQALRP